MYAANAFLSSDGRPQWEVEAKIIREKSQGVSERFSFYTTFIIFGYLPTKAQT